ncbi:hypothetical protein GPECTOR_242g585 [Gonium pectorale]|uniref:ABC transporter family G domain-containing protein n=1 Tax=Gonium pectorale TaxID=33097 RepID=A0A150FWC7_GONPE|nr:hypothetical protein GPECTOR_242g585 [Gonium pectorale]|eukprot:KXZ41924.1 hypothetical protein GPECTOR_242g585 [Gonium pectorale]
MRTTAQAGPGGDSNVAPEPIDDRDLKGAVNLYNQRLQSSKGCLQLRIMSSDEQMTRARQAKESEQYWLWFGTQLVWLLLRTKHISVRTRKIITTTVIDTCLLLAAACIVGGVQGNKWDLNNVPFNVVMAYLVQAVLATIVHLRTFTSSKGVLEHECKSGLSPAAAFLSLNLSDLGWVVLAPAIYMSVYVYIVVPRASFSAYYTTSLLITWWSSGLSYFASLLPIAPETRLLLNMLLILILGAFLNGLFPTIRTGRTSPGRFVEGLLGFSYNRWAMEAAVIQTRLLLNMLLILILGAFLNGLFPTIRTGRTSPGRFVEGLLGFSYNRWAMEAAVIQVES